MTDISNMISELARAKDALELVPKLQSELNNTKYDLERARQNVEDRELAIIDYKRQLDELHAKVRSLEVERDEAGFHALEADDRAAKALKLVRTAMDQLDQTVTAIEPPKAPEPAPIPVVEAVHSISMVETIPEPFHSLNPAPVNEPSSPFGWNEPNTPSSAVDPGPAVGTLSDPMQSSTAAETPSLSGAYAGKRYIDIPGYVSRFDWLAGGGTEDDYDYRG